MSPKARKLAFGFATAVCVAAAAFLISRSPRKDTARKDTEPPRPQAAELRLPGPAEEPVREYDANHQMARVRHKDANGLSPLELVNTPEGVVTVQRTFNASGVLLKEEAFLDGKPVPLPLRNSSAK